MKKIKYILKCIKNVNIGNMFKIIKKIHKKSGKCSIWLFIDIIYCAIVYGSGYYDYQEFEFYNLTNKERKTYLTRTKNNNIVRTYNNKNKFRDFDDKGIFNDYYKDYLKRDYLVIDEEKFDEFKEFVSKHKEFIVKPIDGSGGKGIDIISFKNGGKLKETFDNLILNHQLLLEELIKQNKEIDKLYDGSVNSLRLFTFFDGKDSYVLNSVFKIGNGGVTDNFSSGSMYTFVDDEGVIIVPAIDQDDNVFDKHPISGTSIVGFQVPFYKEACELVCECAKMSNDVRYIGWDVAITDDGPVIIEGNCYPGVFQIKPSLNSKHEGLIPKYQKYMKIK